jgi:hypothetical protein
MIATISIATIQSKLIPSRLIKKFNLEKAEYEDKIREENSNTDNLKGVSTPSICKIFLISHQVTTTLHTLQAI